MCNLAPEKFASLAKEAGLTVAKCGTISAWSQILGDPDALLATHTAIGAKNIGIGYMPPEWRDCPENITRFIAKANEFAKYAASKGFTVGYHNHSFEYDIKFGDESIMDILYEDAKEFQFELDTCWVYNGKADPAEWIRKVGKRMEIVHYKDLRYDDEGKVILSEVGNGLLDWDGIIEACRETGIRWYIVEQDTCPGHPLDSMKQSFDYLAAKAK